MKPHALALAVLLLSLEVAAEVQEKPRPQFFSLDPSQSSLSYTVSHKLHTVLANSSKIEGRVMLRPDGGLQVMVRAPVASFDSGNSNRDAHMLEVMEAAKHPYVVFKGHSLLNEQPSSFPATYKLEVKGELDFHGRKHPETVQVELTYLSASELKVGAAFEVSLTKYEVERPSLMLIKLADECRVSVDLRLKEE